MKIIPIFSVFIILINSNVFAQKDIFTELKSNSSDSGEVHLYQDAEIRLLLSDYVKKKKEEKGTEGYRIQIFFGSGHSARKNANKIRNDFVAKYKDISSHVVFEDPNFKVRVGDVRTKSEALKILSQIQEDYKGAYIVKDFIEFPELDVLEEKSTKFDKK
jgi:hypothetical protein